MRRGSLQTLVVSASLAFAAAAHADVMLGAFDFDSTQFGDSLVESDGGAFSSTYWLNVVNSNPGNPGFLTGANFNTGIANIGEEGPVAYTIGYDTPIVNDPGADFGVVVARFSADDFLLSLSADGTNFSSDTTISAGTAVSSGVTTRHIYGLTGNLSRSTLFVHSIDLTDFGFSAGASIAALRITAETQLDLIRAAGFATAPSVPEPASLSLLGLGLAALGAMRRSERARAA